MAPKRRNDNTGSSSFVADAAAGGVPRRSSRLAQAKNPSAVADPEPSKKKKAKTTKKKGEAPVPEPANDSDVPSQPATEDEASEEPVIEDGVLEGSKTIVIEHCKQCNSFKTRAIQVKNGLEKEVKGVNVVLNPEKPRRGCFEIRKDGGEVFVSLLNMKRPFTPMKNLDMEQVISDIVEKLE